MIRIFTFLTALLLGSAALADTHPEMSTGTVTAIDTKWNRVTLDHGPLVNLDMPAMTMVFQLADPAMLEGLNEGSEIRFVADRVAGKLTVTEIAPN